MNELIKRPHPAIVHFPLALFPVSFIFLIVYWSQHNVFFLNVSFWCLIFGAIAVIPVAATGFMDMVRLKSHSDDANRPLNLHMINGIIITALSVIGGLYFFFNPPAEHTNLVSVYTLLVAVLALLVATQGYLGAVMVYQKHLGIDGDTR